LIGFQGFDGLSFLNTLTHPLDEWHQLKLLEQLKSLDPEQMPQLPHWLHSSNAYVVLFALRLAEIYQQFHVHTAVVTCLTHHQEKVRAQAIQTLSKIASPQTADILVQRYAQETPKNRLTILKTLREVGSSDQFEFLTGLLKEGDNEIRLEAAAAIAGINREGRKLLEALAEQESGDLRSVYKHVIARM